MSVREATKVHRRSVSCIEISDLSGSMSNFRSCRDRCSDVFTLLIFLGEDRKFLHLEFDAVSRLRVQGRHRAHPSFSLVIIGPQTLHACRRLVCRTRSQTEKFACRSRRISGEHAPNSQKKRRAGRLLCGAWACAHHAEHLGRVRSVVPSHVEGHPAGGDSFFCLPRMRPPVVNGSVRPKS